MITIVYNNSNTTIYRIPINNYQTKIFVLPHRSDPQSLQLLIDLFNQTNSPPVISTTLPTTINCHEQNFLLFIIGLLVLFFLIFFFFLFKLLIYRQQHRYHCNLQHNQSPVCVTDDHSMTKNLDKKSIDNNNDGNDDDNDDDDDDDDDDNGGEKEKTMVSK